MKVFRNVLGILITLTLTLAVPVSPESLESASSENLNEIESVTMQQQSDIPEYSRYLKKWNAPEVSSEIINLIAANSNQGLNLKEYEGRTAVYIENDGIIKWEFQNRKKGYYRININYNTGFSKNINYEMSFRINGEVPYSYANSIILPKAWSFDIPGGKYENRNGIDIKPPQIEKALWNTHEIKERDGYYKAGLMVYLPEGENTMDLKFF